MNNLGPWEKNIRGLSDDQKVAPPGMIWDNVEAAINKEKKRRVLFFWLFALGLLGLGIGGYYGLRDKENLTNKPISISNEISSTPNSKETSINNGAKENTTIEKQSLNSKNTIELNKNNSLTLSRNSSTKAGRNSVINTINKNQANKKSRSIVSNLKKVEVEVEVENKTKRDLITNSIDDLNTKSDNNANAIETPLVLENSVIIDRLRVEELYSFPLTTDQLAYKIRPIEGICYHDENCPAFRKRNTFNFFLEAEGNAGLSLRTFTAVSDYKELYNYRKDTEQNWYLWGAGFHAGVMLNEKWSIATGVNFTQVKEKFITTRPGYSKITIHYTPPPEHLPLDTVVETGTLYKKIENRFSLIDIPLTLGYEHRINNWGFALEAGINFNLSLKTRGQIFNANQDSIILEEHDDIYKPKLGFGVHAAFTVHRYFTDRTSVYIRPYFNSYLKDWTQTEYPLKISYSLIGVNIGVRHRF